MTKDHVVTLVFTAIVLLGGGGLALGAFALGSVELAYSLLGFAGGLLSGGVMPRLRDLTSEKGGAE